MYFITKADDYTTNIRVLAAAGSKEAAWEKMYSTFIAELTQLNNTAEPCDAPIPLPSMDEAKPHWCCNRGDAPALFITDSYATIVVDGELRYLSISQFPTDVGGDMKPLCRGTLDYMVANYEGLSLTGKQKSQLENILQKI